MKTLLLAATAAVALSAGAAHAQDMDYTGFYVGGFVGGSKAAENDDETVRFDRDLNGEFGGTADSFPNFSPGFSGGRATGSNPTDRIDDDEATPAAGIRAGYDVQFGNFVVGGVAEFEQNNTQDSVSAFSTTPANYVLTRELDTMASIRARVGYAWNGYLPYVTAGVAKADVAHSFTTTNGVNTFTGTETDHLDGYQLGAGIEKKLGPVSVGLEYLFTSLEDEDYSLRVAGGPAASPFRTVNAAGTDFMRSEDEFNIHAVRVTTAYRF